MSIPNEQPNILIIMSDQHSPNALGILGNEVIKTPNLDRLATEGTLFRNCYCNAPICVASRMAFMTGQYAHQVRAYDNGSTLAMDEPTFAHALTRAGYETVICSRMHFNGIDQHHGFEKRLASELNNPIDYGPDSIGFNLFPDPEWGNVVCNESATTYNSDPSPRLRHDDYTLEQASDYLKGHEWGKRPFCLMASFVGPHPYAASREECREIYEHYLNIDLGAEELTQKDYECMHPHIRRMIAKGKKTACPPDQKTQHRMLAEYYSRVTYLDRQIGELLNTLDNEGLRKDTIVLYVSDHGSDMGIHGCWGKANFFENVVKVPLIISDPRAECKGKITENVVSLVDVFPTLCEISGAGPMPFNISGKSLLDITNGEKDDNYKRCIFSEFWGQYARSGIFMLRKGNLKFNYYIGEAPELFDLNTDPKEKCNLAGKPEYADDLKEMEMRLREIVDPEVLQEEVLQSQAKRQFINETTASSIQTKQRIKEYVHEYHTGLCEPSWDDNKRQSKYESFLN